MVSNLQTLVRRYVICNNPSESLQISGKKFEILLESLLDYVFLTVITRVKNRDDAQDVTSDVLLKVYKALKKDKKLCFKTEAEFFAWLNKIIFNTLYDFLRRQKIKGKINPFSWFRRMPDKSDEGELIEESLTEAKGETLVDTTVEVEQILAKLGDKDRTLLILRYYYGYSIKEIAAMFGKKPEALRKYVYRLLKRIKMSMSQ